MSLFTCREDEFKPTAMTRVKTGTYLWVEEKSVLTPGERFHAAVHVVVRGCFRELATVLVPLVLDMGLVFHLDFVGPDTTDEDCDIKVSYRGWSGSMMSPLTGRNADVPAANPWSGIYYRCMVI
jgi:hypothetical protein